MGDIRSYAPERLFPHECHIIVDGIIVDRVCGPCQTEDSSMASALRSVWNAWTSCKVWPFEDQRKWGERQVRMRQHDLDRLDRRNGR